MNCASMWLYSKWFQGYSVSFDHLFFFYLLSYFKLIYFELRRQLFHMHTQRMWMWMWVHTIKLSFSFSLKIYPILFAFTNLESIIPMPMKIYLRAFDFASHFPRFILLSLESRRPLSRSAPPWIVWKQNETIIWCCLETKVNNTSNINSKKFSEE